MCLPTTLGDRSRDDLGLILPHEHVLVDLGPPGTATERDPDPEAVVETMAPELRRAREAGVTALVECTPVGVGRRVDIVRQVSEAADFPVVVATGIYQAPYWPDRAREASVEELAGWMVEELTGEVEDSGVRAGFVKVAVSDEGVHELEERALRAAARASVETGAAVASHTSGGDRAREELDVLEDAGMDPGRFVWVHAQTGDDAAQREVAERGAYVELDAVGREDPDDDYYLDRTATLCEDGFERQVLLSHDRGWYDPSNPGGGDQDSFTYLPEQFLPALRERVGTATADRLVRENPFDAFAR
jgi:phosphotriesterase-related protein